MSIFGKIAWPFRALVGLLDWKQALQIAAELALKTDLGSIVKAIVEEMENVRADLPGIEKHKVAVMKIIKAAKALKLFWRTSLVNLLIELAVYLLQRKLEG